MIHDQMGSEILFSDIWPKLVDLGIIELRVNDYTEYSDSALDVFYGKPYYQDMCADYWKAMEEDILNRFKHFHVQGIEIKVVEFHHTIADVYGYFDEYDTDNDAEE